MQVFFKFILQFIHYKIFTEAYPPRLLPPDKPDAGSGTRKKSDPSIPFCKGSLSKTNYFRIFALSNHDKQPRNDDAEREDSTNPSSHPGAEHRQAAPLYGGKRVLFLPLRIPQPLVLMV